MKNHLSLLLLVPLSLLNTISAEADPIQDVTMQMANGDDSARSEALMHFVDSLGTVNGRNYMSQAIPLLTKALGDSNVEVRENAATGLLMIAAVTSPLGPSVPSRSAGLASDPTNQEALLKATSDSDDRVRLAALKAYSTAYRLTPSVEDKIIAEFNKPDSQENNPGDKVAMIECLILGRSPSSKAQTFLSNLIDDPKYGVHVAERIGADNVPLSPSALDKLISKLAQDKDSVHRAAFARAIGAYGKLARQYRPKLQSALVNEKDDVTKANIQAAINKTNQ